MWIKHLDLKEWLEIDSAMKRTFHWGVSSKDAMKALDQAYKRKELSQRDWSRLKSIIGNAQKKSHEMGQQSVLEEKENETL